MTEEKTKKEFKFRKQLLKEGNIQIWMDYDEIPRMMAMLLYHDYNGYPSTSTERFKDNIIKPICYVPSLYEMNKNRKRNMARVTRVKKNWGVFPTKDIAHKYLFFCFILGYLKWTEKSSDNRNKRGARYIYKTRYGKEKVKAFKEIVDGKTLEQLDTVHNYPLYIIKKQFIMKNVKPVGEK